MYGVAHFLKNSKKPEIIPIVVILGGALSGAVYMSVRQARAPDVAWDHKNNPYPWQDIKEGEQVKLFALNQKYDGRWERTKW
ncbi:NADH-ubiquinone reductase complex 1 MLRQ subunit-domain-containing protein [Zychaea mexicana]|uniref:NADH-ubiquinone reductase complex 1 MLRQ subunit-domain-containing protein n=1 Tax=Zychaea mexicana TaxID=64656 RepID=UPI0022FEA5CC|nr:NADH-ubiquinone reductase complex 1 MLRQ subunit-domain-containing protein [Zychaea mexicana]KAI9484500.1 NADH-ubiquinone reductase complex 1 MLRQ subunit-domain-containing protein [Zychaea mexicana]